MAMTELPMPDWEWLRRLPLLAIHRQYVAPRAFDLPTFPGSVVRSALGALLYAQACPAHHAGPGQACLAGAACAWGTLFESSPDGIGPLAGQAQAPHPMALRVLLVAANLLDVRLVLMGSGLAHADAAQASLDAAALQGLGRGRVPALAVVTEPPAQTRKVDAPLSTEQARLNWLTPLRLVRDGRPLAAQAVTAQDLLGGLLRRANLLVQYHGLPGPEPAMPVLSAWVRQARLEACALHFDDGERYSARQEKTVPLGGLMGTVDLDVASTAAFWPLLQLGTQLQVGKGTVQGLGCFELNAVTGTHGT